jgi:hypothetical protein
MPQMLAYQCMHCTCSHAAACVHTPVVPYRHDTAGTACVPLLTSGMVYVCPLLVVTEKGCLA